MNYQKLANSREERRKIVFPRPLEVRHDPVMPLVTYLKL